MSNDSLNKLHRELDKYRDLSFNDNINKFLDTIDKVASVGDASSIKILYNYIDDKSEYQWVMESIIIALESYDINVFLDNFLPLLGHFMKRSVMRTKALLFAILNKSAELKKFISKMHLAPKKSLLKLFDIMEKESPHHAPIIQELRTELEKSPKVPI